MNLRAVGWLIGCILLLLAAFMLAPALVAAVYTEAAPFYAFLQAAALTAVLGAALTIAFRGATVSAEGRADFFPREGLATVGVTWLIASVVGALPFLFSGAIPSFADAFFETASGFTTTGSTILTGERIDALPRGLAFWRSLTHWAGGIGIVLVFVVLFPTGGRSLFRSEVPGISREATQHRVRDSALGLVRAYVGLTLVQVVVLKALGLSVYEAAIHSFGTLATGGFSNHAASVGWFGSWKVELVIVVFMFAAGINFAVYDTFLRQGWRTALKAAVGSSEVRLYTAMIVVATLVIAGALWFWGGSNGDPASTLPDYARLTRSLRDSVFAVVSVQTSTGYATADFDRWPDLCRLVLMLLAVVGACAGSTGGGVKVVRFMILCRAALSGVRRFARPRAIQNVRIDGQSIDDSTVAITLGYWGLWLSVFVIWTLLVGLLNGAQPPGFEHQGLVTASTSVLATLNNIGPGLAAVGPAQHFAFMSDGAKLVLAVLMILGRLEFYALVVLLAPRFWRH
jgi:trk system potassium uptake protein TrkH